MFRKLLKKKESGFTIIEVMIVLAIAGLIMVVVFIAVPQLQRNQRNSARTADAARVGASVQNWSSNNNGLSITTDPANPAAAFNQAAVNANLQKVIDDMGSGLNQYTLVAGTTLNAAVAPAAPNAVQTNTNLSNILIITGAKCGSNGLATQVGAGPRSFVILYAEEASSATPIQTCQGF